MNFIAALSIYALLCDIGKMPMDKGKILVREVGMPWMFVVYMVCIFLLMISFTSGQTVKMIKLLKDFRSVIAGICVISMVISVVAGRLWYVKINYTDRCG